MCSGIQGIETLSNPIQIAGTHRPQNPIKPRFGCYIPRCVAAVFSEFLKDESDRSRHTPYRDSESLLPYLWFICYQFYTLL